VDDVVTVRPYISVQFKVYSFILVERLLLLASRLLMRCYQLLDICVFPYQIHLLAEAIAFLLYELLLFLCLRFLELFKASQLLGLQLQRVVDVTHQLLLMSCVFVGLCRQYRFAE